MFNSSSMSTLSKLTDIIVEKAIAVMLILSIVKYFYGSDVSVYTDEWLGYNGLQRIYDHTFVKHNEKEYVNGSVHTNTIEGFWSLLKRGIVGIYHFTSKKHLQKYVDEFAFRYNTRNDSNQYRFNEFLYNLENRLTYKELIG